MTRGEGMTGLRGSRGATARLAVLAAAVAVTAGLAAGLAACGAVTASGADSAPRTSPASSSPGSPLQGSVPVGTAGELCAGVSKLTGLTVTRLVTLRNHLHFPFPARVQVTSPVLVRTVAAAACRLPAAGKLMVNCPADLGVGYRLAFSAAGRSYPVLSADATGCQKVSGLDPARQANPAFWATLGRAIRVSSPGAAAFRGTSG